MRVLQGSHPQSWPAEPVDNEALCYLDLEIPQKPICENLCPQPTYHEVVEPIRGV